MKKNSSVLALALMFVLGVFGCAGNLQNQAGGIKNISQEEFATIVQEQKAIVMDVRTPSEISNGIIKGTTVFADVNGATFASQIEKLDKSKTYIVYCRSGARSSTASDIMIKSGFTKVYNLTGGISNWKGEISKP